MFQSGDLVQLKSDCSDCSDWAILAEEKDFLRHPPLKVDVCQESTSPGSISNITFKYQNQDNQQKELKLLLSTLSYFEPWKPSFQVGDLVRIVCASQFKNRVFKIEEITNDNFNHQFKLSNKFYYSSSEIESAGSGSIQVGDHVLIIEKGNYFNKIGVVTGIPSIFIYVMDKNNKDTSFYPCDLTLVESSTPLSDFYSKEMSEFRVGDLVRVITFSLKEDPTVYKITEMSHSNQLHFWEIKLSNGLWYSLKSIRPAAPIQVGDHVLVNESSESFRNKIAAVKTIETTVIWLIDKNNAQFSFYPKYLTLVESTTPLSEFYPPIKILNNGNPISSTDEISYLRSEKETLNTKLDTLNQEKLEWTTSGVKLRLEIIEIRLLAHRYGIEKDDLQGQLMLANLELEKLKKNAPVSQPSFTSRLWATSQLIISEVIFWSCWALIFPFLLTTHLLKKIPIKRLGQTTTSKLQVVSDKIKSFRASINQPDLAIPLIATLWIGFAVTFGWSLAEVNILWFQEVQKADSVLTINRIPSPNDPIEKIKDENRQLKEQVKKSTSIPKGSPLDNQGLLSAKDNH